MSYFIGRDETTGQLYIDCLTCGWHSFNPNDIAQRYCGHCHQFHQGGQMQPDRKPRSPVDVEGTIQLPTHCQDCGVVLQGGATKHKEGCQILAIIREHFPNWNPPVETEG